MATSNSDNMRLENNPPDVLNELRTISKGGIIGTGGKVAAGFLAVLVMPFVVRILGAENFGLYTLANRLLDILVLFVHLGFTTSIARFIAIHEGEGRLDASRGYIVGMSVSVFVVSAFVCLIVFLFPQWISIGIFHKEQFTPVARIVIFALPPLVLSMLMVQATIAKGTMFFKTVSDLIVDPVKLVCIFIFCRIMGMGITGAVIAILAMNIGKLLIALLGIKLSFPIVRLSYIRHFRALNAVAYSFPLSLAELSAFSVYQINSLVGARWLTAGNIGIYGSVFSISLIGAAGSSVIASIFMPMMADLYNRARKTELKRLYETSTRWAYHISVMPLVFLAIKSKTLLMIFGVEFTSGATAMRILSSAFIISAIGGYGAEMLIMAGRPWLPTFNYIIMGALNIASCIILVPKHGINGLAIAASIGIIGSKALACAETWIYYGLHPFTLKTCKPAAAILISAAVLLLHFSLWWVDIAVTGALFVCAYAVLTILMKPEEDDRFIAGVILKKLHIARSK